MTTSTGTLGDALPKEMARVRIVLGHYHELGNVGAIDALLSPAKPSAPDRIWGWRDSQLSIARHYGGCDYNGQRYVIDEATEGQPLVRLDVITRENKAKTLAAKLTRAQALAKGKKKQEEIF